MAVAMLLKKLIPRTLWTGPEGNIFDVPAIANSYIRTLEHAGDDEVLRSLRAPATRTDGL